MKGIFSVVVAATLALTMTSCAQGDNRGGMAPVSATNGRILFLKTCAHCHGADAHGDEGPDLHHLDLTDQQIASRIRNGKKGQMTAFYDKLNEEQIEALVGYLRGLN